MIKSQKLLNPVSGTFQTLKTLRCY
jgi:hypothetical protein